MTEQLSYDHLRQHPTWIVQGVFDPDGKGGDFAYTIGLHDRGFPELHLWARPTLGDDPGVDWMFSMRDRTLVLNEFAARLLTGGLEVGSELEEQYDGGQVTVRFRVDPPGDRDELEALGIAPGAEVLPLRWSLHRAPEGEPVPLTGDALRRARLQTLVVRHQVVGDTKPPRGWELPDTPSGWAPSDPAADARDFAVDQRYGPLTPLVLARAAQFWQADDYTLEVAVDLALALDAAHCLGHAAAPATAMARSTGRRKQLELLHKDVHDLVGWLTERPAAGRRWRSIVENALPAEGHRSKRERLREEGHCARVLGNLVLSCLLTDAVSDVADPELLRMGRGPWLTIFDEPDHSDLWAPDEVLAQVKALLRPLAMPELLAIGVLHDNARQSDLEEAAAYCELAMRLTAWAVTGAAVCPWHGLLAELPAWWPLADALGEEWCRPAPPSAPMDSVQRWATCLTSAVAHREFLSPEDVNLFTRMFGPTVPGIRELLVWPTESNAGDSRSSGGRPE